MSRTVSPCTSRNVRLYGLRMWKIGELARRTGLTVRTLHHYDAIGLLSPAERSTGGHRVYGEADVGRLYRIVSLRSLGFPLDAIAAALDEEAFDPRAAVEDHLARLEDQIEQQQRLRVTLRQLLERLDTEDFLTTIEELTMRERYYTPDQLEELEQRRQAIGDEKIREVEREWAEIFATLRTEMDAGTDPADPKLRPLAERGRELITMFTGGDPGITASLKEMWAKEDPETVSHGMVDAEVMAYYGKVQAAI
jgi:DNA-binding transcriptional MerR regulator